MWHMPSETATHARTWLAFPVPGNHETDAELEAARVAWAAVANAASDFESVTVVVDPEQLEIARPMLSAGIELMPIALDDAWIRDMGPTFVLDEAGEVAIVDWVFNGWGQQPELVWDEDSRVAARIADALGIGRIASPMVNEGGGLHVDGEGTVLITRTVQLDPFRNPGWTEAEVEAELLRTLGADNVIWFDRGLTRDYERFGTRGHVDMFATIPSPGVMLLHRQGNPEHPDFEVGRGHRATVEASSTADGAPWEIVEMPAPRTLRDDTDFVDWNYANHLVVNGGVIACRFDDPADEEAAELLGAVYPGRSVVTVDARPIFHQGGGIHCITQQQPASRG